MTDRVTAPPVAPLTDEQVRARYSTKYPQSVDTSDDLATADMVRSLGIELVDADELRAQRNAPVELSAIRDELIAVGEDVPDLPGHTASVVRQVLARELAARRADAAADDEQVTMAELIEWFPGRLREGASYEMCEGHCEHCGAPVDGTCSGPECPCWPYSTNDTEAHRLADAVTAALLDPTAPQGAGESADPSVDEETAEHLTVCGIVLRDMTAGQLGLTPGSRK